MKLVINFDRIVESTVKTAVRGYDKAKGATPAAIKSATSFKDRLVEAGKAGKEAARK